MYAVVVSTLPSLCGFGRQGIYDLGHNRNAEEVDKSHVLVADNLALVDETEATKVIAEFFLTRTSSSPPR